jgi:hypothetical protein
MKLARLALLLSPGVGWGADLVVEPVPTSAALTRVISGDYENRSLSDRKLLGTESFRLAAYRDGSRCMQIWSNSATRGTQISSTVCVDANFRPIEAHARYWIGGAYRGSGWVRVNGEQLTLTSVSAAQGKTQLEVRVPDRFSIGTHPISGDAWHAASLRSTPRKSADEPLIATSFTFNPSGKPEEPLSGSLVSIPVEILADERVTVPAGTFATRKVLLAGQTSYWVTGDDWIVVKSGAGTSERVLVRYVEGR